MFFFIPNSFLLFHRRKETIHNVTLGIYEITVLLLNVPITIGDSRSLHPLRCNLGGQWSLLDLIYHACAPGLRVPLTPFAPCEADPKRSLPGPLSLRTRWLGVKTLWTPRSRVCCTLQPRLLWRFFRTVRYVRRGTWYLSTRSRGTPCSVSSPGCWGRWTTPTRIPEAFGVCWTETTTRLGGVNRTTTSFSPQTNSTRFSLQ